MINNIKTNNDFMKMYYLLPDCKLVDVNRVLFDSDSSRLVAIWVGTLESVC